MVRIPRGASSEDMYTQSWRKHMLSFTNFSDGLNTVTTDDVMGITELRDMENQDLGEQGSMKRRGGMVKHVPKPADATGMAQGYFRYYKPAGGFDEIEAIGGKLYKNGVELPIAGLASFQSTRRIEAVNYKGSLYIATGSGLVQYDGTNASTITAIKPTPMEYLYLGGNLLFPDPTSVLTDGDGLTHSIQYINPNFRKGIANEKVTFSTYAIKVAGTVYEYKYSYRKLGETNWIVGKDFTDDANTWEHTFSSTGDYEIKVEMQPDANTDPLLIEVMVIPKFSVTQTNENETIDFSGVDTCNRIFIHNEQVVLYGDTENPKAMYTSDIYRPGYFPMYNTIEFESEKNKGLTAIVKYRNTLIAFTETSIQALYGSFPSEYQRVVLNTSIGCIAPFSVVPMDNYVAFLSNEGVYVLKSVGISETRMNVEKIDHRVENIVPKVSDAVAAVYDSQFHLIFPGEKKRLRFYVRHGAWTRDTSEKLDINGLYFFEGELYGQQVDGTVQRFDPSVFDDDGYVYTDMWETKYMDLGSPYGKKKLKEIQVMVGHFNNNTDISVAVYADAQLILSDTKEYAQVMPDGTVEWVEEYAPTMTVNVGSILGQWKIGQSPFGHIKSSVFKIKISGKCNRTKVRFTHNNAVPNQIFGFGMIFKSKKP
jgi:hypothetical protein